MCVLWISVAGIVGYAVGKASYMRTCREKLGPVLTEGFRPDWAPRFGTPFFGAWGHR